MGSSHCCCIIQAQILCAFLTGNEMDALNLCLEGPLGHTENNARLFIFLSPVSK